MSRTPELGAVLYNTEATWAEVSTTFGTRLQTVGPIDVSKLQQQKLVPNNTTQLRNEITPGVNGIFGGEFEVEFRLTGHGSTAAGAITLSAFETLFGIVLGNAAAASSAGTTATAGGSATALNVALASGYTAGSLCRNGTIGDGRGNGQYSAVSSHSASVINLLVAIDAALNNGDPVYNPAMIYTTENPTASPLVTSTRWRFLSGNLQYDCRGCYPKKLQVTGTDPAAEPTVRFTFGVSYFTEVSTTFPDATSVQTFAHAPVSCGSLFLNTYGTTTRNATSKVNCRSFALTYNLAVKERFGGYGNYANQVVTGANRLRDSATAEICIDAPDATTAPDFVTKWSANSPLHWLYTLNAEDGKSVGMYCPYFVPDGDRPVQYDMGGVNAIKLMGRLGPDRTKSTDLERSMLRIASS